MKFVGFMKGKNTLIDPDKFEFKIREAIALEIESAGNEFSKGVVKVIATVHAAKIARGE
jgi:hypothetical protein